MELTEQMIGLINKLYIEHKDIDAVLQLASLCGIGRSKYFYDGIPLRDYCKKHGLVYGSVIERMDRKGMTLEESVLHQKNVMVYKGKSLFKYCKDNKLSYNSIYCWLKDHLNTTLEDAVEHEYKRLGRRRYDRT